MTDVTIRGIDDDIYSRFSSEAKRRGVPIGELTTLVMRALVDETVHRTYRIGMLNNLSVSRKDLESLNGTVKFFSIKKLEFADDIDWPLFDKYVEGIESVSKVLIPGTLTRFQVLTKCRSVSEVLERDQGR
jgi:hypothetical protein